MKMIACAVVSAAQLVGVFAVQAAGQNTGPLTSPPAIESMYGPDLYRHYCATCHGRDGKGDGPAAAALKSPPSDLTALARRQGGVFPAAGVDAVIRGTAMPAHGSHGSAEMPVWGPIFRALDPSDARVKARIAALVAHLASIQQQ